MDDWFSRKHAQRFWVPPECLVMFLIQLVVWLVMPGSSTLMYFKRADM